jgi:curved DNA-binding protein CbpA
MTGQNWEPWTPLNLTMPSINLMSGFDTKEVKKAYRNLAKSYHPDKRHTLPVEEQEGAHEKWISIVRAYETLTERTKFDNWINYGNPEGSMVSKSFSIAMPAFMSDPKNQIYILAGCFLIIIIVPAVVIFNTRESDEDELCHPETKKYLPRNIIKALEKILKKKGKDATNQLSDEAWADIYQETIEFLILAHRFQGKINLRTFMTARLSGKGI